MVKHLSDEQLKKLHARRPRSREGVRRLQGGRRAQGRADRHPRPDDQGLRPGRGGRGQEHHPPAEEAERGGAARRSATRFGIPDLRRRGRRGAVLPARRGQPGDAVPARAPRGARRLRAAARSRARSRSSRRPTELFEEFYKGTDGREASTTMVFVRMLSKLLRDKEIGKLDRADRARRGAHLRHGGAVPPGRHLLARRPALRAGRHATRCSTTRKPRTARFSRRASPRPARCRRSSPPAPPTPTHGINMIPFFIYYSMFGFQRIGDLIWAAADMRVPRASCSAAPPAARRSTGEGPAAPGRPQPPARAARCRTCMAYDPAFAYELAVIIQDGIRRMYDEQERHLLLPHRDEREVRACRRCRRASTEGILKGHVPLQARPDAEGQADARSCSAAARSCNEVLKAQEILAEKYGVAADVWSVTSYKRAVPRRPRVRALEPAAPGARRRACPTSPQCLEGRAGRVRGGVRLREGAARRRSPAGCRGRSRRSAPTASAAARTARRCATSSRSTPRYIVAGRRCTALARDGQIDADGRRRRPSRTSSIDPDKTEPARSSRAD